MHGTFMADTFDSRALPITAPPSNAEPVIPSDTTDLAFITRALFVGTTGNIRVLTHAGQDVTYKNVTGTKVLRVARVFATGTTATDIVAEW